MTTTNVTLYDDRVLDLLAAAEAGIIGLTSMIEGGEHIHTARAIAGLEDLVFLAIEHLRERLEGDEEGVHEMDTLDGIKDNPKVAHADDIG